MTPADPSDETVHEWVSFELGGETFQFDLTFLLSNWSCLYGEGCPGIDTEPAPELEIGCCSHGAHFADKDDRRRTLERIAQLTDEDWQFRREAEEAGGAVHKDADAGAWVTRVHGDACIMLNRPDHPAGAGCALHLAALRRGERPLDWKPYVCWQLPLRLDFHTDDNGHVTNILREWKRRDWGEGGADFHWWCTESHGAYVGHTTVLESLEDEIVALVGAEAHARLVELVGGVGVPVPLPVPTLKNRAVPADRQVL